MQDFPRGKVRNIGVANFDKFRPMKKFYGFGPKFTCGVT